MRDIDYAPHWWFGVSVAGFTLFIPLVAWAFNPEEWVLLSLIATPALWLLYGMLLFLHNELA